MFKSPHVLVIGASGRFLAQSAVLAGWQVSVIDLFCDLDTQQFCSSSNQINTAELSIGGAYKVDALGDLRFGEKIGVGEVFKGVESDRRAKSYTIVFSGGAENYAEFFRPGFWPVSKIAGPSESSIKRLLSWSIIQNVCQRHQIQTPRTIFAPDHAIDNRTTWLKKQIRSGGGLHLQPWTHGEEVEFGEGFYLQEKMDGPTVSGCFVAKQEEGRVTTVLLGACRQLPNENLNDFRYQGSLGPVQLDARDHEEMERVGRRIASEFFLNGVFGIDFILSENGLHLVDTNPRIPASAELIERYYRISRSDFTIVGVHLDATERGQIPSPIKDFREPVFSKTIIYLDSQFPLVVNEKMVEHFQGSPWLTDVPAIGTLINPCHPVITVHAEAQDEQSLTVESIRRIKKIRAMLSGRIQPSQK